MIEAKQHFMIDPNTAWLLVKQNPKKTTKTNMTWHSLVQGHTYNVIEINPENLIIQRQDPHHNETLTSAQVIQAAHDFNNNGFHAQRGSLIHIVAKETACSVSSTIDLG